jgi:hypothetical protein
MFEAIPEDADNGQALAIIPRGTDLAVSREPSVVLAEASRAAQALKGVIDNKAKKVTFNGKTYLEFEDWQTVGRFYGVTAKATETRFVEYGEASGFEATAIATDGRGMEISRAEAMCLNDEPNWSRKPLFQLKSMAQTRAMAKALRNVLAWVVVMAGYAPTPAEEMAAEIGPSVPMPKAKAAPTPAPARVTPEKAAAIFGGTVDSGTEGTVLRSEVAKTGEKNGKPWTKYVVEVSGVGTMFTFSESAVAVASGAMRDGTKVSVKFHEDGKYGKTLDEISPILEAEPVDEGVPF